MQRFRRWFAVLIFFSSGLTTLSCGGNPLTGEQLNNYLASQGDFGLDFANIATALQDASELCGQPNIAATIESCPKKVGVLASPSLATAIHFNQDHTYGMTIQAGDQVITEQGTWQVVDGHTIDLTNQGGTARLDVIPMGTKLHFTVDKDRPDLNCSPLNPAEDPLPPELGETAKALQGIWCYYSAANGYPLYLGIKVEGENFQVASIYEAYVSPEGVVGHPLADSLAFREVAGVIDESDGLASIPLPSDQADLSIFNNWVPLLFNGITKNYIKVKYGPNKIGFFKKMDSSQGENCPELKVLPEELARLPQVDDDGDGFMDYRDNCPKVANTDQTDGDQDGEGNVCEDPCDDTPFDASCSAPSDFDEDGVDDFVDNCPEISNNDQKDSDDNGIGDACQTTTTCPAGQALVSGQCLADTDDDGVEDSKDNCPAVANTDQQDADDNSLGDACDVSNKPIEVPDGFSLYGNVESDSIQIVDGDLESSIAIYDYKMNGVLDKNGVMGINLQNADAVKEKGGIKLSVSVEIHNAGLLQVNTIYTLEDLIKSYGHNDISITFPNQEPQKFKIVSGTLSLTSFPVTETGIVDKTGIVAGQIQTVLEGGKGELSMNFSGVLDSFVELGLPTP